MVKKLPKCSEGGYTIVEALVAILILSIGILPSLSVILRANDFSLAIKNNLVAANLAQEGVEVVRAIRDANWLNGRSFDSGLSNGTYRVQWNSSALVVDSNPAPLILIDGQGLYSYSSGMATVYTRKIFITKIDPGGCNCELKVVAEITWLEKKRSRVITVEVHLFNWN